MTSAGVEGETVAAALIERFQQLRDRQSGRGGIETHQPYRGARPENRDHDRVVIDRVHENVAAVALVIERIELDLADSAGQFLGRGK